LYFLFLYLWFSNQKYIKMKKNYFSKFTFTVLMMLMTSVFYGQGSCSSPIVLATNGTVTVSAISGTYANNCFNNATTDGGGTIMANWYSFTPASTGEVTLNSNLPVNVAPNSVDTRVSIFTGTCASLTCYDGNDDVSSTNYLSNLTFPVVAGTTYYIAWDNYWDGASFEFDFTFTSNTCVRPYYINPVTGLTTTDATLNWDASVSNPGQYEIEYGLTGFTQGTGTLTASITPTLSLSGLSAGQVYDYYIRSNCGASQSAWTSVNTFALAKVCPYNSGFDSTTQLAGWTTLNMGGGAIGLGTVSANAQSPAQYFILNTGTAAAANSWVFSPPMLLAAGESVTTTFYTRCGTARNFRFTVGTSNSAAAQTTVLWSNTALLNTTYTQQTATAFVAPTTGIYYFGWNDISGQTAAAATLRLDTVNFTSVLSSSSFSLTGVKMYPNPATDILTIQSENEELTKVSIVDLNGRTVKEVSNNFSQISLGNLAKGIYMVTIEAGSAKKVEKLIVE
jgi:hypothetical protein